MNTQAVQHDADGVIRYVLQGNVRDPVGWLSRTAALAPGLTTVPVEANHDALTSPYRWKVQNGALIKKIPVNLAVDQLTVTATATTAAPVTTTVRLPTAVVPVTDGRGSLPTAIPSGTRIQVVHDDPTFYSEPTAVG